MGKIIKGKNVLIHKTVIIDNKNNGKLVIGNNVRICPYTVLEIGNGELIIEDGVVIGAHNWFQCGGGIYIGKNTILGPHVTLLSSTHYLHSGNYKKLRHEKLVIGSGCWLGASVTVRGGIELENNCVIGANSFVNKNCDRDNFYGGVPAKKIERH